ncbi:protein kinase [Catenulispora yoronensis]
MEPLRAADPRRISSYEILNRLGAGGMGQVYLGRSPSGRRVAVKVIRGELTSDPTFRERFRREVVAMRQVSGFFTAPVVDADPDGDPPWLATAYVPGPSLSDAVKHRGPMPQQDALVLAAGLAEALIAIHREGLTHRDLKPANVLLADDGPRVIDFGLAVTAQSSSVTQAGTVVGTPSFMSPEQVSGQPVGPSSDVWSLGAVLLWAATGRQPFGEGGTMEMMFRVVNGVPDLSGLSGTLLQLVTACMSKDAAARPSPGRILEVLSEGAGVEATAAMGWIPPQAAPTMPGPTPPQSMPSVPSIPSVPSMPSVAAMQGMQAPPTYAGPAGPQAGPQSGPPSNPSNPSAPTLPPQGFQQGPQGPPSNPSNPSLSAVPMYHGAPPTQAAPVASPWASPSQPSPPYGVPLGPFTPPKKNRNGLIAAIGGVVAVAAIGGGIAVFASGGGGSSSGGSSSGGTLGGSGGIDQTGIAADFPLNSLVTDADANQYLKTSPDVGTPLDNSSDDPATYDETWDGSAARSCASRPGTTRATPRRPSPPSATTPRPSPPRRSSRTRASSATPTRPRSRSTPTPAAACSTAGSRSSAAAWT